MDGDTSLTGEEFRAYLKEWRTYYLEREKEIEKGVEQFYLQEATRLVKAAYSVKDPEKIKRWLYDPEFDFVPNSDSSNEDVVFQAELTKKNHQTFTKLKDLACYFILAPLGWLSKIKLGCINDRLYYQHKELLKEELQSIQRLKIITKVYEEEMGDHVFAQSFEEAEEGLEVFMKERGSKAKRVAIFVIGHGTKGTGDVKILEGSAEKETFVDAVKKCRGEYCIPGAVTSHSLVFAQCYGHVGLKKLKDKVQENHAKDLEEDMGGGDCPDATLGELQVAAVATEDEPIATSSVYKWCDYREQELQLDGPTKPPRRVSTASPEQAVHEPLEMWILGHLTPPGVEDEFLTGGMESLAVSDDK